jgi:hypothetical protein
MFMCLIIYSNVQKDVHIIFLVLKKVYIFQKHIHVLYQIFMDPKKKIQVFLENINSCNHQNMGNKFLDITYTLLGI